MKARLLLVALILVALSSDSLALKRKKYRRLRSSTTSAPLESNVDVEQNLIEQNLVEPVKSNDNIDVPIEPLSSEDEDDKDLADPCSEILCGAGRVCEVGSDNKAKCVCISECPVESDSRRKVCSSTNETYTSDCAVYQQLCWCTTGDERCTNSKNRHIQIEYYGVCRKMPVCTEDEMTDFPRRMRDWLFNVMRDLADRKELSEHYYQMEREAETNLTRRWTNAAIWKWCDLDGNPPDRSISRHELFPIRAPLMALEHCIAPFLNSCDVNNDHKITLEEWGACLELEPEELEDRCDSIAE